MSQDSDNPDLRDRGYIYWRLLSTDPVTAKEVVLSEKPLISEETDLIEPTLLDELICHIGSLASVYHKTTQRFRGGEPRDPPQAPANPPWEVSSGSPGDLGWLFLSSKQSKRCKSLLEHPSGILLIACRSFKGLFRAECSPGYGVSEFLGQKTQEVSEFLCEEKL